MIYTTRLTLRAPTDDDAVELNAAMNEVWPELQQWMSWAADGQQTLQSTQAYIAMTKENAQAGSVPLIGTCKQSGRFVIASGLDLIEGTKDEYATGYWVSKDFLGKGYATESTNAVIRYAFGKLNAKKIHIEYYDGNAKSKNVIDKLGFTFAHTQKDGHICFADGKPYDIHKYEMTDTSTLADLEVHWD